MLLKGRARSQLQESYKGQEIQARMENDFLANLHWGGGRRNVFLYVCDGRCIEPEFYCMHEKLAYNFLIMYCILIMRTKCGPLTKNLGK